MGLPSKLAFLQTSSTCRDGKRCFIVKFLWEILHVKPLLEEFTVHTGTFKTQICPAVKDFHLVFKKKYMTAHHSHFLKQNTY